MTGFGRAITDQAKAARTGQDAALSTKTAEQLTESARRTKVPLSESATAGKAAGTGLLAVGAAVSACNIATAPEGQEAGGAEEKIVRLL